MKNKNVKMGRMCVTSLKKRGDLTKSDLTTSFLFTTDDETATLTQFNHKLFRCFFSVFSSKPSISGVFCHLLTFLLGVFKIIPVFLFLAQRSFGGTDV